MRQRLDLLTRVLVPNEGWGVVVGRTLEADPTYDVLLEDRRILKSQPGSRLHVAGVRHAA